MLENLTSATPEIQLCSSVVVIYCTYGVLKLSLLPKAAALALGMARLRPNEQNKTCSEVGYLNSLIPEDMRCVLHTFDP